MRGRDLKLDNIMLGRDGFIKLTDYGLAKAHLYGPDSQTHTFCGTPDFMAPEIVLERAYDRSVDWWAFGVLLYELLVGKAPFYGKNEALMFKAIVHADVKFPSSPKVSEDGKSLIKSVRRLPYASLRSCW